MSKKLRYEDGSIVYGKSGILYESFALDHLSDEACLRLAEIHNDNPDIDYEHAEDILIKEGLFIPED